MNLYFFYKYWNVIEIKNISETKITIFPFFYIFVVRPLSEKFRKFILLWINVSTVVNILEKDVTLTSCQFVKTTQRIIFLLNLKKSLDVTVINRKNLTN